jgi:hypothetical protein
MSCKVLNITSDSYKLNDVQYALMNKYVRQVWSMSL